MEIIPDQESVDVLKHRAVALLIEKGPQDQEAIGALIAWTERKEQEVEANRTPETEVAFEVERAELYFEAGLPKEAREAFIDAIDLAENHGLDNLANDIAVRVLALKI